MKTPFTYTLQSDLSLFGIQLRSSMLALELKGYFLDSLRGIT
jgi:hypothetical protein